MGCQGFHILIWRGNKKWTVIYRTVTASVLGYLNKAWHFYFIIEAFDHLQLIVLKVF